MEQSGLIKLHSLSDSSKADSISHVWNKAKKRDLKVESLQINSLDQKQRSKEEKYYIMQYIEEVSLRHGPMKNTWKKSYMNDIQMQLFNYIPAISFVNIVTTFPAFVKRVMDSFCWHAPPHPI